VALGFLQTPDLYEEAMRSVARKLHDGRARGRFSTDAQARLDDAWNRIPDKYRRPT
jgi:hypothetical protein